MHPKYLKPDSLPFVRPLLIRRLLGPGPGFHQADGPVLSLEFDFSQSTESETLPQRLYGSSQKTQTPPPSEDKGALVLMTAYLLTVLGAFRNKLAKRGRRSTYTSVRR